MQRPLDKALRIGTRGSPLALYQAELVQSKLMAAYERDKSWFPIKTFTTSGDKFQGELSEFGGKGLFTKELERALLTDQVDLSVHSMKDVPTLSQDGLEIIAVLEREDPRDAFISPKFKSIADLPKGALVGTASIRRRAQLLSMRPDIEFMLLRGSVGKRVEKLAGGACMASFLAYAGLKRLGQTGLVSQIMPTDIMLPAPAQGAIGLEIRSGDSMTKRALEILDHRETHMAIKAERGFLEALNGSCRTPIAALASLEGDSLNFKGAVFAKDGTQSFHCAQDRECVTLGEAQDFGRALGTDLKAEIGDRILWDEDDA